MTGTVRTTRRWRGARAAGRAIGLLVLGVAGSALGAAGTDGEYVFRAAGCAACHTDVDNEGPFLAGGRALETPFGTFRSPNITPHPVHGIGAWSADDLVNALRHGEAPDGSHYYPVFPYPSYTRMRRADMVALWEYLQTVPAAAQPNREHALPWYLRWRFLNWVWKLLFFEAGEYVPDPARGAQWNRGAYLVGALAHCGECHTRRKWSGAPDRSMYLAGTAQGPEGASVPNITPDRETGIGRWSDGELREYLRSGMTPEADYAGGLMAEVIDEGLRFLGGGDRDAIVAYLRTVPARHHRVAGDKPAAKKREKDPFAY